MNLAQALKQKNRIAGELVRKQQIFQRENARRNDSKSNVNRESTWNEILELSAKLGSLKGRITVANIGIYPALERMAEYKSQIAFLQTVSKREGDEIAFVGRDQEKLTYTWNSFINQEKADQLTVELQEKINDLQDQIDSYNASTLVDD